MTDNKLEKINEVQKSIQQIKELLKSDIQYISYCKRINFIDLLGFALDGKTYGYERETMDVNKEISDAIKGALKELLNKLEQEYEKY